MSNDLTFISDATLTAATKTYAFDDVSIGTAYVGRMLICVLRWSHFHLSSASSLAVDGLPATLVASQRTGLSGAAIFQIDKDTGITANFSFHLTDFGSQAILSVYAVNPVSHINVSAKGALSFGSSITLLNVTKAVGGFGIMAWAGDDTDPVHIINSGTDSFSIDDDTTLTPSEGHRGSLIATCLTTAAANISPGVGWDSGTGGMCLAGAFWGIIAEEVEPPPPPDESGNITFAEEFETSYHDWVIYERNLNGVH